LSAFLLGAIVVAVAALVAAVAAVLPVVVATPKVALGRTDVVALLAAVTVGAALGFLARGDATDLIGTVDDTEHEGQRELPSSTTGTTAHGEIGETTSTSEAATTTSERATTTTTSEPTTTSSDVPGVGGSIDDGSLVGGTSGGAVKQPLPGEDWNPEARGQFVSTCTSSYLGMTYAIGGASPEQGCGCFYDGMAASGLSFEEFNEAWSRDDPYAPDPPAVQDAKLHAIQTCMPE
jgi:hypothetical protein